MAILLVSGGRKYRLTHLDAALLGAIHRGPQTDAAGQPVSPLGLFRDLYRRAAAFIPGGIPPIDYHFHGGAAGADKGAAWVFQRLGLPGMEFAADWIEHGRPAGPIRNRQMAAGRHPAWGDLGVPSLLVAFPGGAGTADMMDVARKAGIPVLDLGALDLLQPFQRWTRDDAWTVRAGGAAGIESVRAQRPGVGPPIVSGHWLKVRGEVCLSAECEYIGRDAHGLRGHPLFANPFPVRPCGKDKPGRVAVLVGRAWQEMSEAEALQPYRSHLAQLALMPSVQAELVRLVRERRVLVCWCGSEKPCHATVVAEMAMEAAARVENKWLWSQVVPSPA